MKRFVQGLFFGSLFSTLGMYFYDPHHGKRRRTQMRDQTMALGRDIVEFFQKMGLDAKHRFEGIKARTRRMIPEDIKRNMGRSESAQSGMKQQAPAEGAPFPS